MKVGEPVPDELRQHVCQHRALHRIPRVDCGCMEIDVEPEPDHRTEESVSKVCRADVLAIGCGFPVRSKEGHEKAHPLPFE